MQQSNTKIRNVTISNARLIPEIVKIINEGYTVTLLLRGISMRPFLEDRRDIAVLTAVKEIRKGDPVLAEDKPGHYVLHRIVDINGNNVTLRGDGNINTEHCTTADIRASVKGFYRKGRKKLDSTDGIKWRTYSWIWMHLLPLRRYLLAIHRRLFIG